MNSINLLSTFFSCTNHSETHLSSGTKEMAAYLQGGSTSFFFNSKRCFEKKPSGNTCPHILNMDFFASSLLYHFVTTVFCYQNQYSVI